MLKLLLDEHIFPGIAEMTAKLAPALKAHSIHDWREGRLLNQPDLRILREAGEARLTLVTFDVNTIPVLLAEMAELGESHAGVIFVSIRSFAQNDYGALARALAGLWKQSRTEVWTNRVVFLQKAARPSR